MDDARTVYDRRHAKHHESIAVVLSHSAFDLLLVRPDEQHTRLVTEDVDVNGDVTAEQQKLGLTRFHLHADERWSVQR